MRTTAKAIKATLVIDPVPLASIEVPNRLARVTLAIETPGRTLRADLSAKSLRKAVAAINTHGPAAVSCVLQGKLGLSNDVTEAGIAVQPKVTAPVRAEAA